MNCSIPSGVPNTTIPMQCIRTNDFHLGLTQRAHVVEENTQLFAWTLHRGHFFQRALNEHQVRTAVASTDRLFPALGLSEDVSLTFLVPPTVLGRRTTTARMARSTQQHSQVLVSAPPWTRCRRNRCSLQTLQEDLPIHLQRVRLTLRDCSWDWTLSALGSLRLHLTKCCLSSRCQGCSNQALSRSGHLSQLHFAARPRTFLN